MNNSTVLPTLSAQVSGALRYERVAQLEAVIAVRQKNEQLRKWRWILGSVGVFTVVAVMVAAMISGA